MNQVPFFRRMLLLMLFVMMVRPAGAQEVVVDEIPLAGITLAEAPAPLVVPVEGGEGRAMTLYTLAVNLDHLSLTATLDAPMPAGTRLYVDAESLLGRPVGMVDLTSGERVEVVAALGRGRDADRLLTFTVEVDPGVELPGQTRTVTLSLYDTLAGSWAEVRQPLTFGTAVATASR